MKILGSLALLALAAPAQAGVITGRVVDSLGNPVAGVNIGVEGSGGPTIANGGTNAGGFFTATITPDGVYDIVFEPPPPPATTHLVRVLGSVSCVGTVNLGNVVLPPGVALTGRAVRAAGGAVVPGVDLDVLAGGVDQRLVGDVTGAQGTFSIAVPAGAIELRLDTTGVALPLLAPARLELNLSGNTDVGDVALAPGLTVSALVKRKSDNSPVRNADLDVTDTLTKTKLFTPGDNTDAAGFVDLVVPAGTYDIEVCPLSSDKLVATTLGAQVVSAPTFLGTIQLAGGKLLSGKVVDGALQALAGVDLDLTDVTTGLDVTLCGDNTNATGSFSVVVPTGVFDIEFQPPPGAGLHAKTLPSVAITANKTLNVVLDAPAGPQISLSPGVAGVLNTFTVTGLAPFARVGFAYTAAPGPLSVPMCPGLTLDVGPAYKLIGVVLADGTGSASTSVFVPKFLAGKVGRVQALDVTNCAETNLLAFTWL